MLECDVCGKSYSRNVAFWAKDDVQAIPDPGQATLRLCDGCVDVFQRARDRKAWFDDHVAAKRLLERKAKQRKVRKALVVR